jgi:hypothetical protein
MSGCKKIARIVPGYLPTLTRWRQGGTRRSEDLCLFDSDMPGKPRSEHLSATIASIGRSPYSPQISKAKVQQAWHSTLGESASDVAFVVTRCAALSNSSLTWRFVELVELHNDRSSGELSQVMDSYIMPLGRCTRTARCGW